MTDLTRGESVKVIHRAQGWLYVELLPTGKKHLKGYGSKDLIKNGYVSKELIKPAALANTATAVPKAQGRTKAEWQLVARKNAFGATVAQQITNGTAWLPAKGFAASRDIIAKVYDYYGALYRRNPSKFQWAGLARMAGGPFFKGFCDMENERASTQRVLDIKRDFREEHYIMDAIKRTLNNPQAQAEEDMGEHALQIEVNQLTQALKLLMEMGRAIFDDLAWQHEAYHEMGLAELRRLRDSRALDAVYYGVWEKIDSGDSTKMWEGNAKLLWFEQHDIIRSGYAGLQKMPLVPTVMSALADSPHPWGKSFYEYHGFPIPGLGRYVPPVFVQEVTKFEDRWEWLEKNIWPTWKDRTQAQRTQLINRSLADLGVRKFY